MGSAQEVPGVIYATLAGSHFNLALRLLKHNCHSPVGDLEVLMRQSSLKEVATSGHTWWILPEDTETASQVDISLWRNQDQNENQGTNEIEILQSLKHAAIFYLDKNVEKVKKADLVATSTRRNPTKVTPGTWLTLAQYYIGFMENNTLELIEDLTDFHSASVDPKALRVSTAFFGLVSGEEAFLKCPHVRHHLVLTQYCSEKTKDAGSPGDAPISQFLENAQVLNFAKKPDQVMQLEKTIRDLKEKYMKVLEPLLGCRVATLEINTYVSLLIRGMFSKPWPVDMEPRVALPTGKMDDTKKKALERHWAKTVDHAHAAINFAAAAGLEEPVAAEKDSVELDLTGVRGLKRNASAPEPEGPKFTRGDSATVYRRMSWHVPYPGNEEFRKDLPVGLQGTIEGWADAEMRQVLFKVELVIDKKKKVVQQSCFPRNLMLTTEYNLWKSGEEGRGKAGPEVPGGTPGPEDGAGPEEDGDSQTPSLGKGLKWVLHDSAPMDVKVESKFRDLLSENEKTLKEQFLRARVFTVLEALLEVLPCYTEKDFLIANRKNDKGVWITEIHAKRDFEAREIQLVPVSSQLKSTHLTQGSNASVTLPKHGRGAHHENQAVALDGRGNRIMAHEGALDDEKHLGALFWVVARTEDKKACNMAYKNVTWEYQVKINSTGSEAKKRKVVQVDWVSSELPMVPVLVNLEKVPKHTQLRVFQKKDAEKK